METNPEGGLVILQKRLVAPHISTPCWSHTPRIHGVILTLKIKPLYQQLHVWGLELSPGCPCHDITSHVPGWH